MTGDDVVIEIGPGRGALTEHLVGKCRRLIAIEIDRDLAPMLRERYASRSDVEIVECDVLDVSLGELAGGPFVLIGNVPYYITTPIVFHALAAPRADRAVYLVQREVAERMAARPGSDAYGALSVNLQALATAEIVFGVPAGAFTPPPKVESAVVRVIPLASPLITPPEEKRFSRFVIDVFSQRRKQLKSIMRSVAALSTEVAVARISAAGLDPAARPETLAPAEFVTLFRAVT
jgi:16S rRNA (adenine1518-N6/adenine1519-N6)-dimethyltransferase